MSILDLRERLMPRLESPTSVPTAPVLVEEAVRYSETPPVLVVEGKERLTLTAPAMELLREQSDNLAMQMVNRLYMQLRGRFVEAEKANGNGAYWSAGDLETGLPTVAGGPLNWLHEERHVVGVLADATYVDREVAAAAGVGPHIAADATLWRWLYPQEALLVERAAQESKLWYSMECVAPQIECVGTHGCGAKMPYLDALRREGAACEHVVKREATRRFIDPIFQGGALILGGVKPGWANADVTLRREASALLEGGGDATATTSRLTDSEAQAMVEQVLAYANS